MTDENTTTTPGSGIGLDDILYALFRRKWMILGFAVAGLAGAAGLFLIMKPIYQSEAKLLLRYVQEIRSSSPVDKDSQIKSPDYSGENIINSELEILNSLDLALHVVEIVGPEKIQGTVGTDTNAMRAAMIVQRGLHVDVPHKSSIIRLSFTHTNPEVPQAVLQQLIRGYLKKHVELHRGLGDLEKFLAQQTDQLRGRLNQTDEALQNVKAKAGIIAPEETRKAYVEQMSRIRQELVDVEASIAERKAMLEELEKLAPSRNEDANDLGVPLEKLDEYKSVCAELSRNTAARRDMLSKYTPEAPAMKRFLEQITRAEGDKKKLEADYPKLATLGLSAGAPTGTNALDLGTETTRVKALEAKAKVLRTQLSIIKTEAAGLEQAETEIAELMRQRAVEEAHFLSYSKSLEQARIQENLGAGKITNIGEVQAPSHPARSRAIVKKMMFKVAGGAVAAGLALALLLELFLNKSIKRPQEIVTKLKLPLFFSLPALTRRDKKLLRAPKESKSGDGDSSANADQLTLWNGSGSLRPYFEAMRDRLIHYFEVRNLTHKPKLVAVTSCGTGAGVSSVAKGLALSLSEAGDGNILLVDMSTDQGAAHSFMKHDLCAGLPEALEKETQQSAQVQDKLFLATADDLKDGVHKVMSRRFNHLVPKMKASDYDFIIFDLPPVSATSITPRLAGFMDLVLEVVEAEKTNRDTAKKAAAVLSEVQPNVSVVVNKYQKKLPAWLDQEV